MTSSGAASGYLRIFSCGCNEFAAQRPELPQNCPGHNRPPIHAVGGSTAQHVSWVQVADRHLCTIGICPTLTRDVA